MKHENLSDEAFRASVVGASEVAALFGCSPWLTHFELWHRKVGNISVPEFNARGDDGAPVNSRIHWGVKLERLVIEEACERWGYVPLDTPKRLDNGKGLGGHPDQIVQCPIRGRGVLEVKTVDWIQRKKWGDEPPLHYLIQPQVYAGLAGTDWADVIVMVLGGKSDLERFQYDFRPVLYADIEARVSNFWQSIEDGKPPKPDYARDGDAIASVIGEPDDTLVDLRRNNRAGLLAADFLDAKARAKAADMEADAAKAELLEIIGTAGAAMLEGYRVGCNMTKGSSGTLVTPEMVGTHVGARKGWRRFDVREVAV
ncbi:MAG: YqaJ viral recombinase family protein [Devosia sp.]|uniref:YqaJ viral recombinase family protein n=1 Tax=Devosia sp. TaxID=1871048 RepID=UPI003395788F